MVGRSSWPIVDRHRHGTASASFRLTIERTFDTMVGDPWELDERARGGTGQPGWKVLSISRGGVIMAINERDRYRLFEAAEQHLGSDAAETLMELLPPVGWADVAVKRDLDQMELLLRSDLDQTRIELKSEIHAVRLELKSDIQELRSELKSEIQQVSVGMKSEIGGFRAEMYHELSQVHQELGRVHQRIADQTRTLVLTMMTMQLATIGATAAIVARFA